MGKGDSDQRRGNEGGGFLGGGGGVVVDGGGRGGWRRRAFRKEFDRDYLLARLPVNLRSSCEDDVRIAFYKFESLYSTEFSSRALLTPDICLTLRDITQELLKSDLRLDCLQFYRVVRSSHLELNIQKLGLQLSSGVDKEQLETLEDKKLWIENLHITVKVLFASEAISCGQIFSGLKLPEDHGYCEAMRDNLLILVGYGEFLVTRKCDEIAKRKFQSLQQKAQGSISEVIKCFSGKESSIVVERGGGGVGVSGETARLEFEDPWDWQLKLPEADVLLPTFKSLMQISGMPMQGNRKHS